MILIIVINYDKYNNYNTQRMIEVSDNEIEYYERKVTRMEQDICLLQEELGRVRMRLRTAEDFQIKYRILTKNNDVDIQRVKIETARIEENKFKERIAQALKENDQHWAKSKQALQEELRKEADKKLHDITKQLEQANKRIKQLSQKKEQMELFSFKIRKFEKENQTLQAQLANVNAACQRQKNEQISAIRNQLNTAFRQRLTNQRQNYQNKISSLTKQLAQTQVQQDVIELRLPQLNNSELKAIKDLYTSSKPSHQREISQLEEIILRKNTEIKALLRQQSQRQQNFQSILVNKNRVLESLQKQIVELKRLNQQEVISLTHQLNSEKLAQVKVLKQQITELTDLLHKKEQQFNEQRDRHSEQLDSLSQRLRLDVIRLLQEKDKAQRQVELLVDKLKERESQLDSLNSQIHDLRANKAKSNSQQDAQYQNGIVFLELQLRQSQQRLKEKGGLYSKLEADFKKYRQDSDLQRQRLQNQLKDLVRKNNSEIVKLQEQIRELTDQLITKNREIVRLKQEFLSEKLRIEVENGDLKAELEELEDDFKRLQQVKSNLESSILAQNDKGAYKAPQKGNAFNHEVSLIYREREESFLRKQNQSRLENEQKLNRIKQKLNKTERQNGSLKSRLQKFETQFQHKQNLETERANKIASIDLEFALTNNLYHQIINSKSHVSPSKGSTH